MEAITRGKVKRRIYQIVEVAEAGDTVSRVFDVTILSLIVLNVAAVILETEPFIEARYHTMFSWFEYVSIGIFTVEYVLRLWSCTADPLHSGMVRGRIQFALRPMSLTDLAAILPFYLPLVLVDLRLLRVVRLFRMFRVFKIGRYSTAFRTFGAVIKNHKEELLLAVFMVFIMLILSSSLLYFVEHRAQPEAFSSIPAAMWWGVSALTTVGYGDMYPVTPLGKFFGAVIAILGIGLFALPAGIMASGFSERIVAKSSDVKHICPHCGKPIDGDGGD